MPEARNALRAAVTRDADDPVNDDVRALAETVRAGHPAVAAVLYYGSGLRAADPSTTLLDFYVLVDSYTAWYGRGVSAALGAALAPNVHYLEAQVGGRTLHAKVAVMRTDQFVAAAGGAGATPHIWARFAQPCRLIHARDESARERVLRALVDAVETFHRMAFPLLDGTVYPTAVWKRGLQETFARELRSEPPERVDAVIAAASERLAERTRLAASATSLAQPVQNGARLRITVTRGQRRAARLAARLARPLGKTIALLRLIKATVTFRGGVDYVLWKVERHSGVRVQPSEFQRRHPLLGGWPLLWKLYRRGGFR
ncbi:hypothetical protein SAMN05216241_10319 [Limimonas halophila]|uniref:Phosphatidate cytidylyltransferase n=1 Tax=Limimonas halophila TaxID=1082479 RepID=A0A1G7PPZ1_9PROT|nr:hypothetical protein [Limimonas halophila]SDF88281.1 hypothetical protein SAMN05216241_10319 [Limimonas halophila]